MEEGKTATCSFFVSRVPVDTTTTTTTMKTKRQPTRFGGRLHEIGQSNGATVCKSTIKGLDIQDTKTQVETQYTKFRRPFDWAPAWSLITRWVKRLSGCCVGNVGTISLSRDIHFIPTTCSIFQFAFRRQHAAYLPQNMQPPKQHRGHYCSHYKQRVCCIIYIVYSSMA